MRKTIKILLSWLCIFALATTALAHSGRTDSSGGHNDNRNKSGLGSYHYHCGGYPAHLHTCGYCPYRDVFPSRIKVKAEKITTEYAWGDNGLAGTIIRDGTATTTVVPHYDSEGEAIGFTVKRVPSRLSSPSTTNTYTYVKNLQGDVLRILDSNGNAVVNYTYDPWGKPTVTGNTDLAALNPCSYRGYDYDEETGFYYLQSRYYDPTVSRFISPDEPLVIKYRTGTLVSNVFVYGDNNPIVNLDSTGYWAETYSGFEWTNRGSKYKGFSLNVKWVFASRTFCKAYAVDILIVAKKLGYKLNMSITRIAQELWFHALCYYIGSPIKTVLNSLGVSWSWLNTKVNQAKYMDINYDDDRAWVFALVWYAPKLFSRLL